MLKLSGISRTKPFVFTEIDGSEHELEVTEYTIGDIKRMIELQDVLTDDTELSTMEQSEIIVASRIICAVKLKGTNTPYWTSIEALTSVGYPNGLIDALYPIANELNPTGNNETLDEKKSES